MSQTTICYEPGYTPTPEQRKEDEKQIERYVNYIRMERELKELRKSFKSGKSYTTEQIRQVIDSRIAWHKERA